MEQTPPRRIRLDLMHPVEKMITTTKMELEKVGGSEGLTKATMLLSEAKDLISDFLDEKFGKDANLSTQ